MSDFRVKWFWTDLSVSDLSDELHESPNSDIAPGLVRHILLERPKFQRALVWKTDRAKKFRDSLEEGFPFGAIVLAYMGESPRYEGVELPHHKYRILDGQQRIYWLNRMYRKFWTEAWYENSGTLPPGLLENLVSLCNALGRDQNRAVDDKEALRLLRNAMSSEDSMRTSASLWGRLQLSMSVLPPTDSMRTEVEIRAGELRDKLMARRENFGRIEVPTLVLRDELQDELATVFMRLNDSVPLSRFELLAAEWSTVHFDIVQAAARHGDGYVDQQAASQIVANANSRLTDRDSEDGGYEVGPFEGNPNEVTLYEYLLGLSDKLTRDFPDTLGCIDKAKDELVLNVAALVFSGSLSKLREVATKFPLDDTSAPDISVFPQALHEAAAAVDGSLKHVLNWDTGRQTAEANRTSRRSIPLGFGLIQASAYLASYVANAFEVAGRRISRREEFAASKKMEFRRNLRSWYLLDAISQDFVGGPAYKSAESRVWRSWERKEPNDSMISPPAHELFVGQVKNFVTSSMFVDETGQIRRIANEGQAGPLMRIVYSGGTSYTDYDRDHIFPLSRTRVMVKTPNNHFANYSPLPKAIHDLKLDKLWAEFWNETTMDPYRDDVNRLLFVDGASLGNEYLENADSFRRFLIGRFRAMVPQLVDNLQIHDERLKQSLVQSLQDIALGAPEASESNQ